MNQAIAEVTNVLEQSLSSSVIPPVLISVSIGIVLGIPIYFIYRKIKDFLK